MKRPCGFTLIELLVVIAIIAILAAILFPIFLSAKESARTASCGTNLQNISRALMMYRDDHGGRNCAIWQGRQGSYANASYDYGSFFFVITRYVGQKLEREGGAAGAGNDRNTVYRCPSARWLKQKLSEGYVKGHDGFAYTMNETGWTDKTYNGVFPGGGIRDSQVRHPSRLIFVAECMGWTGYGVAYGSGAIINNEYPSDRDGWTSVNPSRTEEIPLAQPGYLGKYHGSKSKIYNIRTSHNMGAMLLFYDGHSELRRTTKGENWSLF